MNISYIQGLGWERSTETRISYNLMPHLKNKGFEINHTYTGEVKGLNGCDLILCMQGPGYKRNLSSIINENPNKKRVVYVWDMYPWTEYSSGYDYLRNCTEIWVPSEEVKLRMSEFYQIPDEKCKVIKSYFESFEGTPIDANFVYHPLRRYSDSNMGWTNRACEELGINCVRSEHKLSYEEYKLKVLSCSFLITEYHESSTGGLTLLEGYYHGKNVLVSDSKFQGARDYFGDRAFYFRDGDYQDFKQKVEILYGKRNEEVDVQDRRRFCKQYSIENVSDVIAENIRRVCND